MYNCVQFGTCLAILAAIISGGRISPREFVAGQASSASFFALRQSSTPSAPQDPNQLWAAAQAAYEAGDWAGCARQLREFCQLLPYEFSSRQLLARCEARQGDLDASFEALGQAIAYGWEDEESLQADPALANLRTDPRFADLLTTLRKLREEPFVLVQPKPKPEDVTGRVPPPDEATAGAPRSVPVILFFHGRGESPRGLAPEWQPVADELGNVIVLPKGINRIGQVYTWDAPGAKGNEPYKIERAKCIQTADAALDWLRDEHQLQPSLLVLAGFSQGAVVAAELAAGRDVPPDHATANKDNPASATRKATGLLLISGAFSERETYFKFPQSLTVAQFVGKHDKWLRGNTTLHNALIAQNVESIYEVRDAGHELPRPFAECMLKVLRDSLLRRPAR